ncbi:MAG: hypothetical protein ACOY3P_16015 [Planctomycetota bacterium]
MARRGRRPILDEAKQREVVAMVAAGCTRRAAASHVGCSDRTIRATAAREPQFRQRLRHARAAFEIGHLRSIRNAAQQGRHWRAAAWALERRFPSRYAARHPEALTLPQVVQLLFELAEIAVREIPVAKHRTAVLRRLQNLVQNLKPPKRVGQTKTTVATSCQK